MGIASLALILALSPMAAAADITGMWDVTISNTAPDGTIMKDTGKASLQQAGDMVTGTVGPDEQRQSAITEGSIKENKIVIKISPVPSRTMTFELTINGDKLTGTVSRTGDDRKGNVEFVRAPQK